MHSVSCDRVRLLDEVTLRHRIFIYGLPRRPVPSLYGMLIGCPIMLLG